MSTTAQKGPDSPPASVEPWIPIDPASDASLRFGAAGAGQNDEPPTMQWMGDEPAAAVHSLKLLGWIALGVGAPLLAAAAFVMFSPLFDVIEYQAPPAPSAPETAARSDPQLLTQNPADYDWKAAVRAERRRLEIYVREMQEANAPIRANTQNMARQLALSSPQSIAGASPDLPSDAKAFVRRSAEDASPTAPASPWAARDADSTVREVAPDFSELGSVSLPSGVQAAIPTPSSLEASIDSTPPTFGYTGGATPGSDTANALPTPPSGAWVAPAPTPFDALTVVSAPPSVPLIGETAPRRDESDISSPPSPDTPAVDSALRSNATTVALKPPGATSSVVGISSSNTSHIGLAPHTTMATAAASPSVTAARIEGERISRAPTISTKIGSLNEDKPTQAVVDRKLDKNFGAATALLPDGMPPRVLIRYDGYSAEARRRAETFAKSLAEQGYEIADVRKVASPLRSELRFFYAPDEAVALHIGHLTGVKPVRAPSPTVGLMARPGLIELSVSAR